LKFINAVVVAEGAFRGNDDSKTPLVASSVAVFFNLILDPIFMFPLGMGMAGAAAATAVSQYGAAAMYGWRLWKRREMTRTLSIGLRSSNQSFAPI
jgi:Na+-driven multidrug efflux pump